MLPTPINRDWKDTGGLSNLPENYLPRVIQALERSTGQAVRICGR